MVHYIEIVFHFNNLLNKASNLEWIALESIIMCYYANIGLILS